MEIGTAERLTAAASYDLLRRLTEKGVISKERFAKLCSLLRQYNQGTMLPIAENLSDYIVSSFEIRRYSCIPRLHKRKNFLAMGRRFCKKTVLLSGAAPDRGIPMYCERRATMPITAPFLQKSIAPWLYCLLHCTDRF